MEKILFKMKNITAIITVLCLLLSNNQQIKASTISESNNTYNIKINENEAYSIKINNGEKAVSYNKNIATIDENGTIYGLNAGTTKIMIRSENDRKYYNLKVLKPTIKTKLDAIDLFHGSNENYTSKYLLKPKITGASKEYTLLDYDESIISVVNNEIIPNKAGKTSLTISANGISKKIDINVNENDLSLNKSEIILCANGKSNILSNDSIKINSCIGKSNKITWASSNKSVCTVKNGEICGITEGEAVISATANGVTAFCNVKVIPKTDLFPTIKDSVYVGKTYDILCNKDNTIYESSDSYIAVIDNNKLIANNPGTCTITAKNNSEVYSFTVSILPIITSIKASACYFKTKKKTLNYPLNYTVSGPSEEYTFSSNDPTVATVNNNGVLTINNSGTCDIILSANNKESKVKIVIDKGIKDFELNYNKYHLYTNIGNKVKIKSKNKIRDLSFSSTNNDVATVDEKGNVTALKPGFAIIKAEYSGIVKECLITVENTDILFDKNITFIKPGEKKSLNCDIAGYKQTAKYKVKDKKIASVKKGIITGKNIGETTLTIKANGVEKQHKIIVGDCSHDFIKNIIENNSCIYEGKAYYECKICGFTYEDIIGINSNKHSSNIDKTTIYEPSCTSIGKEAITCKECGLLIHENDINMLDHEFTWIEDSSICLKKCKLCSMVVNIKPVNMPEKPSILDPDSIDDIFHVHTWDSTYTVDRDATCKLEGEESIHCSECNERKNIRSIEKKHIYENSKCIFCNTYIPGFYDKNGNLLIKWDDANVDISKDYVMCEIEPICDILDGCQSDRNITICKNPNDDTFINIPNNHVLSILQSNPQINRIVIPDNTECIGDYAFAFMDGVENITLPDNLSKIGKGSFINCSDLVSVNIPDSLHSIGEDAFRNDINLSEILYKDSLVKNTNDLFELLKNNNIDIGSSAFTYTSNFNNHKFGEYIIDIDPTCETKGCKHRICNDINCSYVEYEIMAATGHSYADYTVDISANCVSNGYKSKKCSKCNAVKDITIIEKLNHNYIIDNTVLPTCTGYGYIYYICDRDNCDSNKTEILNPTGHSLLPPVEENIIKPKCTINGSKDMVIYCDTCGEEISRKNEIIDAIGHEYSEDYTIDIEPTCTNIGSKSKHCIRENDDYYDCTSRIDITDIMSLGHDYCKVSNRIKKQPTCTETGINYYDCIRCSDSANTILTYTTPALGHSYSSSFTTDKYPTCTVSGSKSKHCTRNGCLARAEVTTIASNGHSSAYGGSSNVHTKCSTCGVTLSSSHSYSSYVKSNASCTNNGIHTYYCACGYAFDSADIPATGHYEVYSGSQYVHTACYYCGTTLSTSHSYTASVKTPSTCKVRGTRTYTCSCGYSYDAQDMNLAAHNPLPGMLYGYMLVCRVCGTEYKDTRFN